MTIHAINSEADKYAVMDILNEMNTGYTVEIKKVKKQRTVTQNASLHKCLTLYSEKLNDAGFDQKVFYELCEGRLDMSWTPEAVKEKLWRPFQIALTKKESTTDADTTEYSKVHEEMAKRISELTSIYVPWPSEQTMMMDSMMRNKEK